MAEGGDFKYKFVSESEPNEEYICPITNKVMLDPHQTKCCGNHISATKAEKLTKANKPCPLCSLSTSKLLSTTSDLWFKKKILQLQVYCLHNENGCKWEGPLVDVQAHVLSCDQQPWKCQYCNVQTTHCIGTTEHAQNCPKRPVPCDGCGTSELISFCDYAEHMKTCPSQMVSCEFANSGCEMKFPRRETSQHAEKYMSHHQFIISQQNLKLTTAICTKLGVTSDLKEDSDTVEKLQKELSMLKDEMKRKEAQIGEKEEQICKLKEQTKKQAEQNKEKEDEIQRLKMSPSSDDRERQVRRLQEQLQQHDDDVQRLQKRCDSIIIGGAAVDSLQRAIEFLRPKNSLSKNEVKNLTTQLEEIVTEAAETLSQNSCESPVNLVGSGSGVSLCSGKLVRVVIDDLKKPWGVAVGGDKLYAVDNSGSFGLQVVNLQDPSGSVKTMIESASISEITIPPAKCWYPRGVALDSNLNIILVDTGTHRVLKFSPKGKLLALAGSEATPGSSSGQFKGPIGVSTDQQNRVFVCDRLNHRVQILDDSLSFLEEFGQKGSGSSEFTNPWDVGFDQQGNVYVADCGNRCVKVFTPELQPLKVIGKGQGKYKKGDLRAPSSLCVDQNNYLYVTDMGLRRVLVYDPDGNFRSSFGKFTDPLGIAVNNKGHIFVSDNGGGGLFNARGCVQMFS